MKTLCLLTFFLDICRQLHSKVMLLFFKIFTSINYKPNFMKTNYNVILTLLLAFSVHFAFAQKTIIGTVTDETGPLPGVSVLIKGTTSGTETDFDGNYAMEVKEGQILQYSFIGMETAYKTVGASNTINVVMEVSSDNLLEEVVVTGYGARKAKRAVTGSVQEIKSSEIKDVPVTSFIESVKGKFTGLQSINSSGQPGSSNTVIIRGIGSFKGETQPLYVIDGIPMNTTASYAGPAGENKSSLAQLNQADIESITVLKDASSTSIYGARGANGVILITTKKGKTGKTTFSLDSQVGFSSRATKMEVLSADDYIMLHREAMINSGSTEAAALNLYPDTDVNTNWQDIAFSDSALTNKIHLSAKGGNEKMNFFTSIGYDNNEGMALGSFLKKISAKVSVRNNATDNIKIMFNVTGSRSKQGTPLTNAAYFVSPVVGGYLYAPTAPAYNDDGSPNQEIPFMGASFLAQYIYDIDEFVTYRIFSDLTTSIRFLNDFNFNTKIGMDLQYANASTYNSPLTQGNTAFGRGRAAKDLSDALIWTLNNSLNWNKEIGVFNLDVLVGQEVTEFKAENVYAYSENFSTAQLQTLVSGSEPTMTYSYNTDWKLASIYSNLNIGLYDNRYNFTGTYRKDGSSRFGKDNRWGDFWAVGVNWNLSRETFLEKVDWLNNLKLRASYGIQGNQPRNFYDALPSLASGYDYDGNPGQYEERIHNPNLKWEEQNLLEVGIDFKFLNMLYGEANYYERKTNDLFLDVPLSITQGDPDNQAVRNWGAMENIGYEAKLGINIFNKDNFEWNIEGNATFNKNKITKLTEEFEEGTKIRRVGEAYNTFFMPVWAGVNPDDGTPQWYDENDEITGVYDEAERRIVGNADPDYYGGFSTYLRYKDLSLNLQFFTSQGNQIYNNTSRITQSDGGFTDVNQSVEQLKRWQNPGDITDVPQRLKGGNNNSHQLSSRWLEDGSYVRLRDIVLSYNLSNKAFKKIGFHSVRMYIQGHNVYTWTDFSLDPEQTIQGTSWFKYPNPKTYSMGVNISF